MRRNLQPWWKVVCEVRGFEDPPAGGEGGDGNGEGGNGTPTSSSGGNGGEAPPAGQPGGEAPKTYTDEDIAGLKSALQKERDEKKALDKEVKGYRKAKEEADDKEKTEIQRLTDAHTKSSEKTSKLAAQFKTMSVESAIKKAARDAKFTDPTDAIRPEVLAAIGVEQDEDDPTRVTIDEASVKAAIKELAKKKPHYLAQDKKPLPPSAPKFGGSGQGGSGDSELDRLKSLYPALNR